MAAAKKVDYEAIEAGWRAGLKSPHELARKYTEETGVSVSHAAIIKHFKRQGIPRDLAAKVKAKADRMVTESMVTGKVTTVTSVTDTDVINGSAMEIANVRFSHRKDIRRSRELALALLGEMEAQTGSIELYEELGELLRSEDKNGIDKRNDLYNRVISSAGRISSMKQLAETLKTLIGLEREAYSIGVEIAPTSPPGSGAGDLSDDELEMIAMRGRGD